ncbi:MAG: hypothetical protein AAF361_04855, partial [Bacteroidota bacterium]
MKLILYLAIIIAILVIGFLLAGLIRPKVSYHCEILVEKPVAESWSVAQDEEKLTEWLPGLQKIEHIRGKPGTVG